MKNEDDWMAGQLPLQIRSSGLVQGEGRFLPSIVLASKGGRKRGEERRGVI